MAAWIDAIPMWVKGNLPVWALFIMVLGYIALQYVKNQPLINQQKIDERLNIKTGYKDTIMRLEKQVHDCHQESRQREEELQSEIDELKKQMNNEALQRVQSEISLISVLLEIVPAPQLKDILAALQKRKAIIMPRIVGELSLGAEGE